MVDFSAPIRIPRSAFELLLARVDEAVARYDVALCLHEDFPFRSLYLISPTAIDYSNLKMDYDPQEIVDNLDQILYFAFNSAPDSAISSWAEKYDEEIKNEAVDRVQYARQNMPHLLKLWEDKNASVARPLVDLSYESSAASPDDRYAYIYIAAARIDSSRGAPDKSDVERIRVQLWPADVRFLIAELSHLWQAHLSGGEDDGGGNDNDGD